MFSLFGAPLHHIPCVTFLFVIRQLRILLHANGAIRIVAVCVAMPCPRPLREARIYVESILIDYFSTEHSLHPQSRRSYYMRLPADVARLRSAMSFTVTITASLAHAHTSNTPTRNAGYLFINLCIRVYVTSVTSTQLVL